MTGTVACVVRGSGTRGAALSPLARVTAPHPGRVLPGVTPSGPGRPVRLLLRCPWYSGNLGLGKMDILLYVSTLLPVTAAKPPPPGERGAVGPALRGGRLLPGRHSRFLLPAPERSLAAEAWARLSHSKAVPVFVVFVIVLQAAVGAFCSTLKKKKKE